jgi:aspartate/methionine/tyrosine aminotransferase
VRQLTANPVLTGLETYFTDLTARARERDPAADWIDLSIGDPLEPTPGFVRAALVDAVEPVSRYPTSAGRPELRVAIAGWLRRRHGVEVDPDRHVLPSAGSKEAIFHLPLALVDAHGPRRHVLWGDPGYPVYERGALLAGGASDPVALEREPGWRLRLEALEAARLERACLAWLNYPHNPTGATVDVDYLRDQVAASPGSTGSCSRPTSATRRSGSTVRRRVSSRPATGT